MVITVWFLYIALLPRDWLIGHIHQTSFISSPRYMCYAHFLPMNIAPKCSVHVSPRRVLTSDGDVYKAWRIFLIMTLVYVSGQNFTIRSSPSCKGFCAPRSTDNETERFWRHWANIGESWVIFTASYIVKFWGFFFSFGAVSIFRLQQMYFCWSPIFTISSSSMRYKNGVLRLADCSFSSLFLWDWAVLGHVE